MADQSITPTGPHTDVESVLHREPSSIAEAMDLHLRLGTLSSWVDDRKKAVAGWVQDRAETRLAEDGAAPTWRLPQGTVVLTDPVPSARIVDQEAFARWYVTAFLGRDPDEAPEERAHWFDDRVMRRTVAHAESVDLLDFLDADAAGDPGAVNLLRGRISVDVEWLVGDATLDDLLAGKLHHLAGERPALVVDTDRLVVVDQATGEAPIPGTTVSPPNRRTVQMRPGTNAKQQVRSELNELLGSAALDS